MKVSLFITCIGDVVYSSRVGRSVVEVLERAGCEVVFPEKQTCCGQPAFNSGYHKEAKKAAKHFIRTFEHAEAVVAPSGSCAGMVKEYPHLLVDEPSWHDRARKLADKTYEFTQFLVDVLNITDIGAYFPKRVTYHTSCHMTRIMKVTEPPVKLLENVEGITFDTLPYKEQCCGFGGTFSVKMLAISEQMVDDKVKHIVDTKAEVLVGSDLGCLMNIGGRLERLGIDVEVMHIAEVLNQRQETGESVGN
ncbi:(Fe-S)-binding protein [Alkalicoccus daliensis]|uniref:L-lactate dehydrogenase complex protein LldE n=1 Tax=Alkalicoccus daliensis TaxID=745820 RepID=A0A1H0F0R0_9BACI|nr:(Fe-S)-binding protein [Alkalicoccus daliensis]SDN88244.1 L-lactate dehydrogenase complex protein LldE [Alkalicoccus daliensis]